MPEEKLQRSITTTFENEPLQLAEDTPDKKHHVLDPVRRDVQSASPVS